MQTRTKISRQELARMRELTMGCWWNSRYYPKSQPDWTGIYGEMVALVAAAETRFELGTSDLAELHELRMYRQFAKDALGECPE